MLRLAAAFTAGAAIASARPGLSSLGHGPAITSSTSSPSTTTTSYSVSSHILSLNKVKSAGAVNKRSALYTLGNMANKKTPSASLVSLFEGEEFATNITINGENYYVIVDSGSSDTWLVQSGFDCVNVTTSAPETEETCNFGKTYTVNKDTFVKIDNENFNIEYGDGEFLTGYMGYQDITIAGITVKNQTMGVVDYAGWNGDGETSGLMGLAFPGLTSSYQGTNATLDGKTGHKQVQYPPIFTNMVAEGLSENLFSLAIDRNLEGDAGYLAFGGLPPVEYEGDFVCTPILKTEESGYNAGWDFYTITIDGVTLAADNTIIPKSGGSDVFYIVDSGTTLNYLPTQAAKDINAAFSPAAKYDDDFGGYVVACNATAPVVGTKISGTVLPIDPLDLLLPLNETQNGVEMCLTGVVDGGPLSEDELYILGDVFLKSLVAVFDVGNYKMAFAPRGNYTSDDPYKL